MFESSIINSCRKNKELKSGRINIEERGNPDKQDRFKNRVNTIEATFLRALIVPQKG